MLMSKCRFNYIDSRYKDTNPKLADELTDIAINIWQKVKNSKLFYPKNGYYYPHSDEINSTLKVVDILNSKKAQEIFKKGNKNSWSLEKILQELKVPKEQIELAINENIQDREQLALELASKYNYAIEVNTSTNITKGSPEADGTPTYWRNNEQVSEEDFKRGETSSHYSNLTVPGGTNYTENEISTPLITPSIKGHAQFSTDQGIGWFRSDEQEKLIVTDEVAGKRRNEIDTLMINLSAALARGEVTLEEVKTQKAKLREERDNLDLTHHNTVNTRRILEVQSDLFQKGRDKEDLTALEEGYVSSVLVSQYPNNKIGDTIYVRGREYKISKLYTEIDEYILSGNQEETRFKLELSKTPNQFLQLLNKDNNWVNFFVKSIIQDSAKKGYEKVLFPSGNTASKVEGHTTLEEFKKQKEDRIKKLEKDKSKLNKPYSVIENSGGGTLIGTYNTEEEAQQVIDERISYYDQEQDDYKIRDDKHAKEQLDNEIAQLKQELERVETEGFGALKSIYNFYQTTIFNVLNKQGFKPSEITDEFSNKWFEIDISQFTPEYSSIEDLNQSINQEYSSPADVVYTKPDGTIAVNVLPIAENFILNINSELENYSLNLPSNISDFYNSLTSDQKESVGDVEQLYNEQTFPMEENDFIDMLKCKI